jgi:hypothetical protein
MLADVLFAIAFSVLAGIFGIYKLEERRERRGAPVRLG